MGVIRHYLTIAGKSTEDFNVWISGGGSYNSPARDIETISVAGRNGDLTIDNGRFENISVEYPCFITENFDDNIEALRSYLASLKGYQRLCDTYHPEEYRQALFSEGVKVSTSALNRAGEFTLTFNCKPQRFLLSGENAIEFTADGAILNETLFASKPLLRVYGTGTIGIGSETLTITTADGYTDIDCDIMDAYKGAVNCNGNIVLNSGDFPTLEPGTNGITLGTATKIIVYPRWFII